MWNIELRKKYGTTHVWTATHVLLSSWNRLSWYLELLDKLQKRICRTVGSSLAASREPLSHHQNVASLSLFYSYYFGRCSYELTELVPLPYSRWRSTHLDCIIFSVTIPRCYKDVSVNSFFFHAAFYLPIECFPLTMISVALNLELRVIF